MLRITSVEPLDGYRLRLTFDDGVVTEVDFSDALHGPLGTPLRDPAYFRQVRIDDEACTIVWPNGLDPDPYVLHGDHAAADPSLLRVRRVGDRSGRSHQAHEARRESNPRRHFGTPHPTLG